MAVCESSEARIAYKRVPLPPLVGLLFVAVSIGLLMSLNLLHEGWGLLGGSVLAATVSLVVLAAVHFVRVRR